MKKRCYSCGDKVFVQGRNRRFSAIVTSGISTTNPNDKVTVLLDDGRKVERKIKTITDK